jgi:AraC-like DNA-binding protein
MGVSEQLILENLSQLIGRNIGNSALSLDDICKELGISRSHLHRIVKEQTGLSTTLFIRRIRLEKAKELLSTTDSDIH